MSERRDVRRMLLARGWEENGSVLSKGTVHWCPYNNGCGDSGLQDDGRKSYSIEFNADVPARVIVATAEAAAS